MNDENLILGMDIGGTNLRAGLCGEDMTPTGLEIVSSAALFSDGRCLAALERFIRDYCARRLDGHLPRAVSIGFPSTLDRRRRVVLSTPNLPGMDNLPVADALEEALGVPVFINRDVNLLMLCDIRRHRLPTDGVIIGCYIGTGLGNAIWVKGELLSGKNGVAGELGHIPVLGNDRVCGCGNTGCMETLAGGMALTDWLNEHFPGETIDELFLRHGAEPFVRRYVDTLAAAIATEVNILDPDAVILGGGVPQMKGFPLPYLTERLLARLRKPYPCEGLELIVSEDHQDSGVAGAGLYARSELEKGNQK